MLCHLFQLRQIVGRLCTGGFRVDADSGIEVLVLLCQADALGAVFYDSTSQYRMDNALFRKALQYRIPIRIKGSVCIMAVCIKHLREHSSFSFFQQFHKTCLHFRGLCAILKRIGILPPVGKRNRTA